MLHGKTQRRRVLAYHGSCYTSGVFYFLYLGLILSFAEHISAVYILNLALDHGDASCPAVASPNPHRRCLGRVLYYIAGTI